MLCFGHFTYFACFFTRNFVLTKTERRSGGDGISFGMPEIRFSSVNSLRKKMLTRSKSRKCSQFTLAPHPVASGDREKACDIVHAKGHAKGKALRGVILSARCWWRSRGGSHGFGLGKVDRVMRILCVLSKIETSFDIGVERVVAGVRKCLCVSGPFLSRCRALRVRVAVMGRFAH